MKKLKITSAKTDTYPIQYLRKKMPFDPLNTRMWEAMLFFFKQLKNIKIKIVKPEVPEDWDMAYIEEKEVEDYKVLFSRSLTKLELAEMRGYIAGLRYAQYDTD